MPGIKSVKNWSTQLLFYIYRPVKELFKLNRNDFDKRELNKTPASNILLAENIDAVKKF